MGCMPSPELWLVFFLASLCGGIVSFCMVMNDVSQSVSIIVALFVSLMMVFPVAYVFELVRNKLQRSTVARSADGTPRSAVQEPAGTDNADDR